PCRPASPHVCNPGDPAHAGAHPEPGAQPGARGGAALLVAAFRALAARPLFAAADSGAPARPRIYARACTDSGCACGGLMPASPAIQNAGCRIPEFKSQETNAGP